MVLKPFHQKLVRGYLFIFYAIYYKLFPGNTHDSKTFVPVFKDVCVRFSPDRVIAVADMGCTSSDNIFFLKGGDRDKRVNGYVFSFSIRKGAAKFKKYNKGTVHGAAAYIKNITFDKMTGEVCENPGEKLLFDSLKAQEDAKYDGYYCMISSELDLPAQRIIEIYRGLSVIEDNFKVA